MVFRWVLCWRSVEAFVLNLARNLTERHPSFGPRDRNSKKKPTRSKISKLPAVNDFVNNFEEAINAKLYKLESQFILNCFILFNALYIFPLFYVIPLPPQFSHFQRNSKQNLGKTTNTATTLEMKLALSQQFLHLFHFTHHQSNSHWKQPLHTVIIVAGGAAFVALPIFFHTPHWWHRYFITHYSGKQPFICAMMRRWAQNTRI